MLDVNEYFDGNVKSIGGFKSGDLNATSGVMAEGEYEFNTATKEYMTVIAGELEVQLKDQQQWNTYTNGQTFEVAGDSSFKVKASVATAYLCCYE